MKSTTQKNKNFKHIQIMIIRLKNCQKNAKYIFNILYNFHDQLVLELLLLLLQIYIIPAQLYNLQQINNTFKKMMDIQDVFIADNDSERESEQCSPLQQDYLFQQQVISLGQSDHNFNDVLFLEVDQFNYHEDKHELNITNSTYSMTNVQESEKKIQSEERVIEHFHGKKNVKYYIQLLENRLRQKFEQKSQNNGKIKSKKNKSKISKKESIHEQSINQLTIKQIPKTKQIKKQKKKSNITKVLSQELGIAKKHLSKLWGTKIASFLKSENIKKQCYKDIQIDQIEEVKKFLAKPSITIKELSFILKSNEWLRNFIYEEELKDDKPLEVIYYASNLTDQSKLIMFETYDMLKEAIINPNISITWDHSKQKKISQSSILFDKCKNKPIEFITNALNEEYEKEIQEYSKNKCSKQNNISYCWNAYLKDIANEATFLKKIKDEEMLKNLKELIQKPASITNIKHTLQFKQFSEYIFNEKIKANKIIEQILGNNKINILNKKNMMESYLCFCSAVQQPETLKNWPKISN